jgi:hypothetical protein
MTLTSRALGASLAALLAASAAVQAAQNCPPPVEHRADTCSLRTVSIKMYNRSRMRQADLDAMLDVTSQIWTPYGVSLQPGTGAGAIAVIVSDQQTRKTGDDRVVLGTTLFSDGHATPYINLSLGAAEAFADSTSEDGVHFTVRPLKQRDAILTRMLGVALAHELAHYLLDTGVHSSGGLLRAGLDMRQLSFSDPARLKLTPGQQRQLCPAAAATAWGAR